MTLHIDVFMPIVHKIGKKKLQMSGEFPQLAVDYPTIPRPKIYEEMTPGSSRNNCHINI